MLPKIRANLAHLSGRVGGTNNMYNLPNMGPMKKMTLYVRPEDRAHLPDSDIIEYKPVDMNYGFVPLDKDDPKNMEHASECNLKRFNLEPKDKPSEY